MSFTDLGKATGLSTSAVHQRVKRLENRGVIRSYAAVLDHDVVPSLVHGDHWTGNVVGGQWLIDPSVHHADRELDLAMLRVFGGAPESFFAAYDEALPLDDGWERRVPALQLYYLVFHVHRFGGGYVARTAGLLDELGW